MADKESPFPKPPEPPLPPKPTDVVEAIPTPPRHPPPIPPEHLKELADKDPFIPDLDVPPRVIDYLFEEAPKEIAEAVERDTARLMTLPAKMDEDVATLVVFLHHQPQRVMDDLYHVPGDVPENLGDFMDTVREGLQYKDLPEGERGERIRRITDVIDLFTPT